MVSDVTLPIRSDTGRVSTGHTDLNLQVKVKGKERGGEGGDEGAKGKTFYST